MRWAWTGIRPALDGVLFVTACTPSSGGRAASGALTGPGDAATPARQGLINGAFDVATDGDPVDNRVA